MGRSARRYSSITEDQLPVTTAEIAASKRSDHGEKTVEFEQISPAMLISIDLNPGPGHHLPAFH